MSLIAYPTEAEGIKFWTKMLLLRFFFVKLSRSKGILNHRKSKKKHENIDNACSL